MGFNHVLSCMTFQYRGLNHFELHFILTIESWLNLNINFDCRYLELETECIFNLFFVVLNLRSKIESKYPSIAFLSIKSESVYD